MSGCEPGWNQTLLEKARRTNIKSNFRGENSSDVPSHFQSKSAEGRSNFIAWAKLPKITYSAAPETLYDLDKLQQLFATSECFVKERVDAQAQAGVTYPKSFYFGLLMGGGAILYTLFRK